MKRDCWKQGSISNEDIVIENKCKTATFETQGKSIEIRERFRQASRIGYEFVTASQEMQGITHTFKQEGYEDVMDRMGEDNRNN